MSNPCQPLQDQYDDIENDIKSFQEELKTAAGTQKVGILAMIRKLQAQLLPVSKDLDNCKKNAVEPNVYLCDDNAIYYVREIGTSFYWFGERKDYLFANVFFGQRNGNSITGRWMDVPKASTQGSGTLSLTFDPATGTFKAVSQTGGFGGHTWSPYKPFVNPGMKVGSNFRKAGYQGTDATNLTGTCMSDDNGTYYIRQMGADIVWFGEGFTFSNIFVGTRTGNSIAGTWLDVPKASTTLSSGALSMTLGGSLANQNGLFNLTRVSQTGNFSSIYLSRVESINVQVNLDTLILHKTNDLFLGDEPFLWVVVVKIDGDRLSILDLNHIHTTLFTSYGSHGDITSEGNIGAGRHLPIPPGVGKYQFPLKTIRGLEPFVSTPNTARASTTLAIIVVALEEDSTSNDAIEAGHNALNDALQTGIDDAVTRAIATQSTPDFSTLKDKVSDAVKAAVRQTETKIYGAIDPDDVIGFQYVQFTYNDLLIPSANIPFSLQFVQCVQVQNIHTAPPPICPSGSPLGTILSSYYEVTGSVSVS